MWRRLANTVVRQHVSTELAPHLALIASDISNAVALRDSPVWKVVVLRDCVKNSPTDADHVVFQAHTLLLQLLDLAKNGDRDDEKKIGLIELWAAMKSGLDTLAQGETALAALKSFGARLTTFAKSFADKIVNEKTAAIKAQIVQALDTAEADTADAFSKIKCEELLRLATALPENQAAEKS